MGPSAVAVNPVTNKIYVANYGSNNVTVIDGATNDTTLVAAGTRPLCRGGEPGHQQDLRREQQQRNVTVIDGATNDTTTRGRRHEPLGRGGEPGHQQDLRREPRQQQCHGDRRRDQRHDSRWRQARSPCAVAVNPVTNKIYVANCDSNNVTVIDGATNDTTTWRARHESPRRGGEPGHEQDLRREHRTAAT